MSSRTQSRDAGDSGDAAAAPVGEEAGYKLGSPYEIDHVWYYPSYDPHYDRTGIASWYGPAFHGRPTANGERFDMNAVTAAHPTLPLPSRVRVTNLENGRQLEMRVNDRGPVRRRAAHRPLPPGRTAARLPSQGPGQGSRRVSRPGPRRAGRAVARRTAGRGHRRRRPEPVAAKPRWTDRGRRGRAAAAGQADTRCAASPPRTPAKQTVAAAGSRRLLVEAAVLDGRDAADRVGDRVRSLGAVAVEPERRNGRVVYAVRIGPVDSDDEAAFILAELNRAGFTGSHHRGRGIPLTAAAAGAWPGPRRGCTPCGEPQCDAEEPEPDGRSNPRAPACRPCRSLLCPHTLPERCPHRRVAAPAGRSGRYRSAAVHPDGCRDRHGAQPRRTRTSPCTRPP